MQFLGDFNDQYYNIKARVLLMEPIPVITKKKNMLLFNKNTSLIEMLLLLI